MYFNFLPIKKKIEMHFFIPTEDITQQQGQGQGCL
jgi:hypothetical protein